MDAVNLELEIDQALRAENADLKRKLVDAEKSAARAWDRVRELEARAQRIREVLR